MITIPLMNREINVNITKKNNKNTYFYFKKQGYIQVNLSKYHTKKYAISYITNNVEHFLQKLDKVQQKPNLDVYYLFGTPYHKKPSTKQSEIEIIDGDIYLPDNTDQVKKFEKDNLLNVLHQLVDKHQDNPYISLKDVSIHTRYTSTRFGSCNARTRRLNFSTHLVHVPIEYIEYVFLHEITHLHIQNHSQTFYQLLAKLCPNHKQLKQQLKQFYRW